MEGGKNNFSTFQGWIKKDNPLLNKLVNDMNINACEISLVQKV